jgi:hypothetical protein
MAFFRALVLAMFDATELPCPMPSPVPEMTREDPSTVDTIWYVPSTATTIVGALSPRGTVAYSMYLSLG